MKRFENDSFPYEIADQHIEVYATVESGRLTIHKSYDLILEVPRYASRHEECDHHSRSEKEIIHKRTDRKESAERSLVRTASPSVKMAVVVTCFCINFLCLGFAIGLGVIFVPVLEVFQASRALTSLMPSLCMGVIFCGALFTGPAVKRLNPNNSITLGGLLALIGCLGGSFAPDVNTLIVTVGFITGVGLSLAYLSSFVTINAILTTRRGMGVSVLTVGSGLGGLLAPLLNVWLLELYGWRGTLLILGGLMFNLTLLGIILRYLTLRTTINVLKDTKKVSDESLCQSLHLDLLKRPVYVIFIVGQLPVFIFFTSMLVLLVDMATNVGFSLQMATYLLSGLTLGNITGSLSEGILTSSCGLSGLVSGAIAVALCGVTSFGFVLFESYILMMICAVLFGAGFGAFTVACPIALLQITRIDEYASALSFMFGISGIGDLIAGPIGGAIRDVTESYELLFILCAAVALTMGVVCVLLQIWLKRTSTKNSVELIFTSTETVVTHL